MRFEVGQRVRIAHVVNELAQHLLGAETTIKAPLRMCDDGSELVHELDLDVHGMLVVAPPRCLEPIDDPPDLGSWSALSDIWVPDGVAL